MHAFALTRPRWMDLLAELAVLSRDFVPAKNSEVPRKSGRPAQQLVSRHAAHLDGMIAERPAGGGARPGQLEMGAACRLFCSLRSSSGWGTHMFLYRLKKQFHGIKYRWLICWTNRLPLQLTKGHMLHWQQCRCGCSVLRPPAQVKTHTHVRHLIGHKYRQLWKTSSSRSYDVLHVWEWAKQSLLKLFGKEQNNPAVHIIYSLTELWTENLKRAAWY